MIKLHRRRVLQQVPPPRIAAILFLCIVTIEQLIGRRDETTSHGRELVVHQAGVETCYEGACIPAADTLPTSNQTRKGGKAERRHRHEPDEPEMAVNNTKAPT